MDYKISVVVPFYGVEKYIGRCAESLMEQTLSDVEFIFVNDCSVDNSMEKLKKVLEKYPHRHTKIINKTKNEGLPEARKTGCRYASGEYVYHMDSDDWIEKNGLEEMYKAISHNNADILCCGFYKDYGDKLDVIYGKPFTKPTEGIDMMLYSEKYLHSGVWCKLVKRSLYKNVVFPPTYMHEDLALMIQLFHYAKTITYLPKAFYHYMQISNVSMIHQDSFKRNSSAVINFKFIIDFMTKVHIEATHRDELIYRINTFKTYSLHKGNLIDGTLYPISNKYIFSKNDIKNKKQVFYVYLAIHHCSFIWKSIHWFKTILKNILGQ